MIGDVSYSRMLRIAITDASDIGKGWQPTYQLFKSINLDKIGNLCDSVDQMDGIFAPGVRQNVEHRQDWGEAGTAGQHQNGADDIAQKKVTVWTDKPDA